MTSPSRTPILTLIDAYGEAVARHRTGERPLSYVDEKLDAVKRELSQSRDDALEEAARVCDAQETESFMVLSTARAGAAAMKAACVKAIRSLKAKPAPIAAPIASGDAVDARRYRHMRETWKHHADKHRLEWYLPMDYRGSPLSEQLDTAIDAAIRKGAE